MPNDASVAPFGLDFPAKGSALATPSYWIKPPWPNRPKLPSQVLPVPKPEISPNAKPLDARAVRFSEPRRGYAWQRLSDLASVLGEQQRHQLIDRCR